MNLFLTLLLAHLIADFPLQTDLILRLKVRHWYGLLLHASFHGLTTAALIQNPFQFWPVLIALWLIHAFIDWTKLRLSFTIVTLGFVLDQFAHGASLILIVYFEPAMTTALNAQYLIPLTLVALIPAFLMLLSIAVTDVDRFAPTLIDQPAKMKLRFRFFSQILGFPIVVAILIIRFLLN